MRRGELAVAACRVGKAGGAEARKDRRIVLVGTERDRENVEKRCLSKPASPKNMRKVALERRLTHRGRAQTPRG